jgi:hypothetical protein
LGFEVGAVVVVAVAAVAAARATARATARARARARATARMTAEAKSKGENGAGRWERENAYGAAFQLRVGVPRTRAESAGAMQEVKIYGARASDAVQEAEGLAGPGLETCRLCVKRCDLGSEHWGLFETDLPQKLMAFAAVQVRRSCLGKGADLPSALLTILALFTLLDSHLPRRRFPPCSTSGPRRCDAIVPTCHPPPIGLLNYSPFSNAVAPLLDPLLTSFPHLLPSPPSLTAFLPLLSSVFHLTFI